MATRLRGRRKHDDHQAAGVIATEAFDLAGDPTAFPEQVAAPRDRNTIANLTEGLRPWQPKKIYYFSDTSHVDFLEGKGPKYETTGICAARQLPYFRLAAEEMSFHLTQGDSGQEAKKALATGRFKYFQQPVRLVFGSRWSTVRQPEMCLRAWNRIPSPSRACTGMRLG